MPSLAGAPARRRRVMLLVLLLAVTDPALARPSAGPVAATRQAGIGVAPARPRVPFPGERRGDGLGVGVARVGSVFLGTLLGASMGIGTAELCARELPTRPCGALGAAAWTLGAGFIAAGFAEDAGADAEWMETSLGAAVGAALLYESLGRDDFGSRLTVMVASPLPSIFAALANMSAQRGDRARPAAGSY